MKRILLVNPDTDSTVDAFREFFAPMLDFFEKKAYLVPLPLATLAALTPDEWEVDIWDEPVRGRVDQAANVRDCDVAGVTGYMSQIRGARRVGDFFRKQGVLTVVGGPGVSGTPEFFRDAFDVVMVGEAENLWAPFLHNVKSKSWRKEYRQITKPDLALVPAPRWDSIRGDMRHYMAGGVQTSRGCPFGCEFCQVTFLSGRAVRLKPIDTVLAEIIEMEKLGLRHIMFCDDNFIASPQYAKDLLRELVPINNRFRQPLTWSTELSLNLARDEELLQLFHDVHFGTVCIGLETPNKEALKAIDKPQNLKTDPIADVHKILSYGIGVRAGLIVGFDSDGTDIFDRQHDFVQQCSLHGPVVNMVKAVPGTRLWTRLQNEGRLVNEEKLIHTNRLEGCKITAEYLFVHTNIIPGGMSRLELMTGYRDLIARVHSWDSFSRRILGWLDIVTGSNRIRPDNRDDLPREKRRRMIRKLFAAIGKLSKADQDAVIRLLAAVRARARHMMPAVLRFVLYQFSASTLAASMLKSLDAQIAHEKALDVKDFVDRRPADIFPAGFREQYARVFPALLEYALGHAGAGAPEVMVEALGRYLEESRRETFPGIDQARLFELVDARVAENKVAVLPPIATDSEDLRSPRKAVELRYEVLSYLERDMRALYFLPPARDGSPPPPVPAAIAERSSGRASTTLMVFARFVAAVIRQRLAAAG